MVWLADYEAWGNTAKIVWHEQKIEQIPIAKDQLQPIRFQGQTIDQETGLHYNRFRYYDPDVGMFISRDPIGLMGGNNVFQYAPNPVMWVDPWGLQKKKNCSLTLGGTLERGNINKNIAGGVSKGYAGHHIISIHLAKNYSVMHKAAQMGYNINRGSNGIALPTSIELSKSSGLPLHFGSHLGRNTRGSADALVVKKLNQLQKLYNKGKIDDCNLIKEIGKIENSIRRALVNNKVRLQNDDPHWK